MKLGLQLFTLIDTMRGPDGLRTVRRQAADAGYDGVEFAGFYGLSPEEIRAELDALHLEAAGIHLGWAPMTWDDLTRDPMAVIRTAQTIGTRNVVVASYPGKTRAEWEAFGAQLAHYGRIFRENGMRLGYHNHRTEAKEMDGKPIIDWIFDQCPAEDVFWELDPRHIQVAGGDPVAFAARYCGRLPLVHMRDFAVQTGPDTADDCAVGDGVVDIPGVIRASGAHDWLIVEERCCPDILAHIRRSAEFLRGEMAREK